MILNGVDKDNDLLTDSFLRRNDNPNSLLDLINELLLGSLSIYRDSSIFILEIYYLRYIPNYSFLTSF